jgi:hypothetical protein
MNLSNGIARRSKSDLTDPGDPTGNGSPAVCAHVPRFCGDAAETDAASDKKSQTTRDWGSVFFTF